MGTSKEQKRQLIGGISEANRAFYSTPRGRGMLRAFELPFEHRWIYLFELVQNAIDAGAERIAIELADEGDGLVFQHDGDEPFEDRHIESLSEIFRSTKGASSVGFMGIGFKSVFGRFRGAKVSGWGWRFRYEIPQLVGEEFGDIQPDLIGAVAPIWDEDVPLPDPGFTTRFSLEGRVDPTSDLASDLGRFLPENDRTPLAILAAAGITNIAVADESWELGVHRDADGSLEATAISGREDLLWQLFQVSFQPSREAIARFLEHRKIQPAPDEREKVYAEAARARQVLGVLSLDNDGKPAPPARGRVYATLPTQITLPLGLHVNADWLLNISRTGLREIEENPWQRDVVDQIADVVSAFLQWVARFDRDREATKAALGALVTPDADSSDGLESLLGQARWLGRLRSQLADAAVLPALGPGDDELRFVKPGDLLVPPDALAEAFEEEPGLLPGVLLQGPVLAREILGSKASDFFSAVGLLREMPPEILEGTWEGGLETWWGQLPEPETRRRDILFRLWGAVADLSAEDRWRAAALPCLRTAGGDWVAVDKAVYFNEALPSSREPGGAESRQFIEAFLPDGDRCLPDSWMGALRQAAGREAGWGPLQRAREWLEESGQMVELGAAVKSATEAMAASAEPDWIVLVPLGHWIMHRRTRPDLLTHVLVEAPDGLRGVQPTEALLADPYVERGEGRRQLFPDLHPIAAAYLEKDPRGSDGHVWRSFFEKAGARGDLGVHVVENYAGRYDRQAVADFLGINVDQIGESNDDGYTLQDYSIEPPLPLMSAPESLRSSIAAWLEDGYSALHGKGFRKASYFYWSPFDRVGARRSVWAERICELSWVPCEDGKVRRPRDVLPAPDPARDGSPVAQLSSELISSLDVAGIGFGTAIAEAPALRKLIKLGPIAGSAELASLLREAREGIQSEEDGARFSDAVRQLSIPAADGRRIPISRVVRRAGGRSRGTLGGWILPIGSLPEELSMELEHPTLPYEFPETTTGPQALEFICEVWERARSQPERLANEVRDTLPLAYTYCLEDTEIDEALLAGWNVGLAKAAVFAEREWLLLSDPEREVFFDDLDDRRFLPKRTMLPIATSGHLGNDREQQEATAKALGLEPLSSIVRRDWNERGLAPVPDWEPRFELICRLLGAIREGDTRQYNLRHVTELTLSIRVAGGNTERIPVDARLSDSVLIVAGSPAGFSGDAASELVRAFSFGQRAGLAARLTEMFASIGDATQFAKSAQKFVRALLPELDPPVELPPSGPGVPGESATTEGREATGDGGDERADAEASARGTASREGGSGSSGSPDDDQETPGGSFTTDRALGQTRTLEKKRQEIDKALEKSLKGELTPEDFEAIAREPNDDGETGAGAAAGSGGDGQGDEVYREAAAAYERKCGRLPTMGDPLQVGWDLSSEDPRAHVLRRIEVKGRGREWTEDEIVELSRPQVLDAFEAIEGQGSTTWWLYVVERLPSGAYRVLPIENPVRRARKWILRGSGWRSTAAEAKVIVLD